MVALCWLLTSATTGRSTEDFLLRSILTWRDWNRKQILQVWRFQRLFCCLLTNARSNIFTHPMQLYLKVKNVTAQAVNSHHRIVFSAELAAEELSVMASPWLQDTVKGNRDSLGGRYSASSWAPLITFISQKQFRSDYSSDQIAKAPTLQTAWLLWDFVRLCSCHATHFKSRVGTASIHAAIFYLHLNDLRPLNYTTLRLATRSAFWEEIYSNCITQLCPDTLSTSAGDGARLSARRPRCSLLRQAPASFSLSRTTPPWSSERSTG